MIKKSNWSPYHMDYNSIVLVQQLTHQMHVFNNVILVIQGHLHNLLFHQQEIQHTTSLRALEA